jgi:mono/diheme cytochrome c family protein
MRKTLNIIILLLLVAQLLPAQDWVVPDDRKGRLGTFPFTDDTRKAGEKLYTVNCASCHGTPGRSDFISLVPPPGDPFTDKFQKNSDGEIFYKVSTGRGQMPSFRSVLAITDIWNLISFIRSSNKAYKQQIAAVVSSSAYPGAEISLYLSYSPENSSVQVTALAIKEGVSTPVANAGIKLFVRRYFGTLQLDEERSTGTTGSATFAVPAGLPGDSAGNLSLTARFADEELFGSSGKDTIIMAGKPTIPLSLTASRAMWNSVRKAPLWILITFSAGILTAWGFIFIVLLKLRDIYIVGGKFAGIKEDS